MPKAYLEREKPKDSVAVGIHIRARRAPSDAILWGSLCHARHRWGGHRRLAEKKGSQPYSRLRLVRVSAPIHSPRFYRRGWKSEPSVSLRTNGRLPYRKAVAGSRFISTLPTCSGHIRRSCLKAHSVTFALLNGSLRYFLPYPLYVHFFWRQ